MYLFACGETSVVKSSEGGHDPILNMERTSDHHNAPTYPFACGTTPVVRSGGGGAILAFLISSAHQVIKKPEAAPMEVVKGKGGKSSK